MPGWFRRDPPPLTADQRGVLEERVVRPFHLAGANAIGGAGAGTVRHHLETTTAGLLHRWDWEAAAGFDLTGDMPVTIAGHAALLVLGLDDRDPYRHVTSVVVHGGGMTLRGPRPGPSRGVVTVAPRHVDGHTSDRGPVFVSWRAVRRDLARPDRGRSVTLHEFAHRLDMLDGVVDGTPPLAPAARDRWVRVCTRHYRRLRAGDGPRDADDRPLLRAYGATGTGEFFAVVTEAFFTRPVALRAAAGDLYGILADYYGQDPAARVPPDPPSAAAGT